jgi:putative addiction module component (TIGR02574 family)
MQVPLSQILSLSVPEKLVLVEAIWDSISSEKNADQKYNLSTEQIQILEDELAAYQKNPNEVISWSLLKAKLSNK